MKLLNLGFQFRIEKPLTTYSTNLISEDSNVIKLLDNKLQDAFRILATKQLKQILNSGNPYNILHKRQFYVVKQLKQKLVTENSILFQADKGKTIVVINTDTCIENIQAFLAVNHFPTLPKDPAKK